MKPLTLILALLSLSALAPAQSPSGAPVRIFASNGIKAVVEDLKKPLEKSSGHPVSLIFDSTAGLRKRISSGEAFEIALLTTEATDALIKDGTLTAASRTDLARAGVGVGYKTGSPKPDTTTAASMKKALLDAKSITYAGDGASRAFIDNMIAKLGLTETLKPRTVLAQGSGPATADVASGKSDLVLTLVSEILPVQGLSLAGTIPQEFQAYISFTGAISAKSPNADAAASVLKAMHSPAVALIYKARGMEAAK